jgi:hypothetical protein
MGISGGVVFYQLTSNQNNNFRRNFIGLYETRRMAIALLTQTTLEWMVYEVFLYTKLFTGPEQFLIQLVFCTILPDLYFMLYCPCMWIRGSMRERWAGWGRGRRGNYFYYVRKPDPREELTRQGYFVKTVHGQFVYMRMYPVKIKFSMEKRRSHSVYEVTRLRRQYASSESSVNMMAKKRKIILSSSGEIFDANAVMGIQGSNGDCNYLPDLAETIPKDMKIRNHKCPRWMKLENKSDKANNYLTKNEPTNGNVNCLVIF